MNIIIGNVKDIDDDDRRGRTALHNAAFGSQLEAVKFLLEHGADTSLENDDGLTPAHVTAAMVSPLLDGAYSAGPWGTCYVGR